METLKCHLWSARRAQPLAELSQAERSEALPREARPPPKAAGAVRRPGAEGDPRASRGLQTKARMRLHWPRLSTWRINILSSAGKRALHVRDLRSKTPPYPPPLRPPRTDFVSHCKTKHSRAEVLISVTVRGWGGAHQMFTTISLDKTSTFCACSTPR